MLLVMLELRKCLVVQQRYDIISRQGMVRVQEYVCVTSRRTSYSLNVVFGNSTLAEAASSTNQ